MVINGLNMRWIWLLLHNPKAQSETNFHHSVRVMLLQLFLYSSLLLHQWLLGYGSQKAQRESINTRRPSRNKNPTSLCRLIAQQTNLSRIRGKWHFNAKLQM